MANIYHGTIIKGITILEPKKRYTPGGETSAEAIGERIYASYIPAFAAAHGFPWSSEDGIDVEVDGETIILVLPKDKQALLEQAVCIYTLPDDTFKLTIEEETGLTYHSTEPVAPIECHCFTSIIDAMKEYGGTIKFY